MKIEVKKVSGIEIAVIHSDEIIITDVQSALDFIALVECETSCNRIIMNKSAIIEEFFDLSTCLAGEILQKFVNYYVILAIVGDFSKYDSKSLRDFIYESNKGKHLFFLSTEQQAIERLSID